MCLDIEKLKNFCTEREKLDEYFDEDGDLMDSSECHTEIAKYPCCSKLAGKYAVVGKHLKSYYGIYSNRFLPKTCTQCEEYSMCERCIDRTENGSYPVTTIFNTIYTIDSKEFCMQCNGHSRTLIPIPPGQCGAIGVFRATVNFETCSHCFSPMDDKCQNARRKENEIAWIKTLKKNLKLSSDDVKSLVVKRGIFAMLDDCTSCT